jgi:LysR family transcriptional regulator, transcriptional activator of nhaA
MDWLNYHHLLYFWAVGRAGSITGACRELRLAPPTISAQIRTLEKDLGQTLLVRNGRRLELTEMGRVVFLYAEEIFSRGRELMETLKDRPRGQPLRLVVGIADVVPKLVSYRLLEPAMRLPGGVRIICREGPVDRLLAQLAVHELDVILSDTPAGAPVKVRAFNHLLGESGLSFFGVRRLAQALRRGFPKSLDGAPFLLPTEPASLRRSLEQWFESQHIRPKAAGEFDDFSLVQEFGANGEGVFAVPSIVEKEMWQYKVERIGRTDDVRTRFYAISVNRILRHLGVAAICGMARP